MRTVERALLDETPLMWRPVIGREVVARYLGLTVREYERQVALLVADGTAWLVRDHKSRLT